MVYHVGETLTVDALTNSIYEESVKAWQNGILSDQSLARFGIAADGVTGFQPSDSEIAIEYAFDTLANASSPGLTVWSIVFDPQNLGAYFRTKQNSQIRSIDFSKLDFTCGTPVQMLDIHADLSGDISDDLEAYSHDASLDLFALVLEKLGLETHREQLESLLQQMERFPCADGKGHMVQEPSQIPLWIWLVAALLVIVAAGAWNRSRTNVARD